jgi:hypothetical protein
VPQPVFASAERRSFLVPILLALAALAAAVAIAIHFFPATTVDLELLHTDLLPTETSFKSQTIVVGGNTEHTLFIVSTIKVDNQLRVPIFLDNFNLTFANPADAQLTSKAFTKDELANAELSFPALKPLLTAPLLLRDTSIDPGKSAQGAIVFSLPIPKTMWDQRKVASIMVDLYHQHPVYQDIPK